MEVGADSPVRPQAPALPATHSTEVGGVGGGCPSSFSILTTCLFRVTHLIPGGPEPGDVDTGPGLEEPSCLSPGSLGQEEEGVLGRGNREPGVGSRWPGWVGVGAKRAGSLKG